MSLFKTYNRILDEHLHSLVAQGNHEAYLKLKRRYKIYATKLIKEILDQFPNSGVTFSELKSMSLFYFSYVVKKYDNNLGPFYTFWKDTITQYLMDYLYENSYKGDAKEFDGIISLDEEYESRRINSETIAENDENYHQERMLAEIRRIVTSHKEDFKKEEFAMLILMLDGYSLRDFEHTGIMSRSNVYLTFSSACKKLKKLVDSEQK